MRRRKALSQLRYCWRCKTPFYVPPTSWTDYCMACREENAADRRDLWGSVGVLALWGAVALVVLVLYASMEVTP